MKVLIVGGTSSLATALRPALARVAQVQTAGRQGCDHGLDLAASAEGMVLPAGFDVVVNTASHFGGTTAAAMDQAVAINVQGTLRLAEASARAGVAHFVQISSVFALLPSSSPFFSAYAATKRQTDELLQLWSRSQTTKLTVLRPSQFYGAGEATRRHQPFLCTLVDKAAKGEDITLFGSHDAQRNFIHIDDVAATIAACVEQGLAGTYACQYPKDHGFGEIARAAVQAFGTASRVDFDPSRPDVVDNVLPIDPTLFDKLGIQPRINLVEGMRMEARRQGALA
jgi:UDP-glucose 4-epimerase